jgi:hypothetical protein
MSEVGNKKDDRRDTILILIAARRTSWCDSWLPYDYTASIPNIIFYCLFNYIVSSPNHTVFKGMIVNDLERPWKWL